MSRDDRFLSVAQAIANARYPISVDPQPQEIDYEEARRFIAAYDAIMRFPLPPGWAEKGGKAWPFVLDDMENEIIGNK